MYIKNVLVTTKTKQKKNRNGMEKTVKLLNQYKRKGKKKKIWWNQSKKGKEMLIKKSTKSIFKSNA